MILLDGKKLSQKILAEIKLTLEKTKKKMRLAVVVVGEDPVVRAFIEQKKRTAMSVGIEVRIYPFPEDITTSELRKRISKIVHEEKNKGVIIQLPLPPHINKQYILNTVPPEKDVDMLSAKALGNFAVGKSETMPPVVGATKLLFEEYEIDFENKYIVLLGSGNLVGRPMALWLVNEKATFSVVNKDTPNPEKFMQAADIIVSGIGKPKYITGALVKSEVIVIDAGTSESEGKMVGDVDFESVSEKASFISPVPGGIGPLTVAVLLKNLLDLNSLKPS